MFASRLPTTVMRLTLAALVGCLLALPLCLALAEASGSRAVAAVRAKPDGVEQPSSDGSNALEDAADRAKGVARAVALSLIGLALAVASVTLLFRRDFKEAAGVFAVGLLAVLLATPSGVRLLQDTASFLFGE
jgi:hypothetical protein